MKVLCVIPARYASTRLPGKPLKDIAGKPMICRVYDRAIQAKKVSDTIVATDDERIVTAVEANGGKAMMTRADHPTGTDRLADDLRKAGIRVDYQVSEGTHHEWLTWRRGLKAFLPKLFRK